MLFRSGELTGAAGLGIRTRIFTRMNLHLMLMAEYGQGLFLNTDPPMEDIRRMIHTLKTHSSQLL